MQFVVYTGDSSDPTQQIMRLVEADSIDEARALPGCIGVQVYIPDDLCLQDPPDERKLKRGMPVLAF